MKIWKRRKSGIKTLTSHLCCGFLVLCSNGFNCGVLQQRGIIAGGPSQKTELQTWDATTFLSTCEVIVIHLLTRASQGSPEGHKLSLRCPWSGSSWSSCPGSSMDGTQSEDSHNLFTLTIFVQHVLPMLSPFTWLVTGLCLRPGLFSKASIWSLLKLEMPMALTNPASTSFSISFRRITHEVKNC